MITRKVPWTSQPKIVAQINLSNPITRGISHAWGPNVAGSSLKDLAGTANGIFGTGTDKSGNFWEIDEGEYCIVGDNTGTGNLGS